MIIFLISVAVTFITTMLVTPKAIVFLNNISVVGKDIQKKNRPEIPEMGGLPVLVGFLAGILLYTTNNTFIFRNEVYITLLAAMLTVTLITLIGMLDDLTTLLRLNVLNVDSKDHKSMKRSGFRQRHKFLLPLPAAVPLMVTQAGVSVISIPFFGPVDIGIFYPLLMIPLAIFGASNATNMLAGMNGLEAGLGIVLISSLGLYAYVQTGSTVAAAIAFIFVVSLVAFLIYNWYPAKMFAGDSLTYTIGAVAATVAILGNIEKFALFCFIPWFIEFVLKARSRFKAESFGVLQRDGTLLAPDKKICSLTHVVMKINRYKEWQISMVLIGFELIICMIAFLIFL
ncbi:MAG: UDP-N-acetylglucosamine--dolichyl-phosphate N-acetylglucosaminephosphotransferase [archaeon]